MQKKTEDIIEKNLSSLKTNFNSYAFWCYIIIVIKMLDALPSSVS